MEENILMVFSVVASLVVAFSVILGRVRAYHMARTEDLKLVAAAMKAHYSTFDEIIDDPALSEDLGDFLCFVSYLSSNEEQAHKFVQSLCDESELKVKSKKSSVLNQLVDLEKSRPDLVGKFHRVVATALTIIFLRWAENAELFKAAMAELSANEGKDIVVLEQRRTFLDRITNGANGDGSGGTPMPAHA